MKKSNRRTADGKLRRKSRSAERRGYKRFGFETLEDRRVYANFSAGNIAVLDLAGTSNNTTGQVLELSPSTAGQSAPVQTISIASTGTNAIRFSGSGTSSFLSDTNDQSLLAFAAYNTTNSTVSDLSTLTTANVRAVATLGPTANFTLQTTYTESTSGDQTRSATSLNDTNFAITDKGGLFTNSASAPSLTTNILDTRSFGGTLYVSSTKGAAGVSTLSSPTATSLTPLPGLPADGSIQDFYLVQSGDHGTSYDVLYTLDQGSSSATINKYSLVNGSWTSNGSYTLSANGQGMIAANDGSGGSYLYVTTTSGKANNSLVRLTDTAGYNQALSITTASNVTLYTDTSSDMLKGLDFTPTGEATTSTAITAPTGTNNSGTSIALSATVTATSGNAPTSGFVEFWGTSSGGVNTLLGTASSETTSGGVATFTGTTSASLGSGTYTNIQAVYVTPGTGYSSSASASTGGPSLSITAPPTVTANSSNIGTNATTVTINGTGFSTTAANDSVAFNLGALGTVTSASSSSLTVTFTTDPSSTGALTAVVTVSGASSGAPVQVATVVAPPTVTSSTANLPNTTTTLTISGSGFSTTPANDLVSLNLGATGTVVAATSTSLTVDLTSEIATTGALTASVAVSGITSGAPVQIATITQSAFTPGNLAVLQVGAAGSDNTTGAVLELNPSVDQTLPVQTIGITSMSFSDSGTSGFLTDSNDGTLLGIAAYNTPPGSYTATSDLGEDTATGSRGVGTLNASGAFNLATTYTNDAANSGTTEQTRSATTVDDTNWYITDKSGLYTNNDNNPGGPTGPSNATNILVTRAFGGTVYVASTKALSAVSTLASPSSTTLIGLPATGSAATPQSTSLVADGSIQDFYLIQSGSNGNTYDVMYTLDQNASNATINKFSLVNGYWQTSGTPYTLPQNATSMIAANNGSGGATLYVVTTSQAANNSVVELTDAAGWNSNLNISAAPTTVYTATGGASLKGIAFAPTDVPNFSVTASAPGTAAIGSQYNYTLTASNAGSAAANGDVEVQFTLPAGLSYVSAADTGSDGFTASYDSATNVVTFSGGSLAAGASDNLTVTVAAPSPATYTVPAGAVVIDPNHVVPEGTYFVDNFNTAAVNTVVTDKADLTVNVSGPSTAYTNQPFNYTLSAANQGTIDADGDVIVQFTLPTSDPNLQFVSASGAGFTASESNGVVTFSGGTIAAGGMTTLTVTVVDTSTELLANGVNTTNTATVPVGAAVISTSDNLPEFADNQTSTSTVTTAINSPIEITGVDVSPVVNESFTGVVATFTDATDANIGDYSATITWANGATTSGTIAAAPDETVTDINNNTLNIDNLFTVTGTYTYTSVGSYPVSVSVSDANNNTANVNPNASVAYAPLVVTAAPAVNANSNVPLDNATVATFTDPGLVAEMAALGISDPTTQFSASVNWGDGSSADSGTITYNAATQVFSVVGSHTYAQTGSYSVSVAVTPMTVSVERIDSSDPTNLDPSDNQDAENEVDGNAADSNTALGLTDAASADFIDQYVIGATGQTGSLYTFSLPTVATTSGNYALVDNSSSRSEGQLTLSGNGEYLVTGGYNATVDLWAPEPGISTSTQVTRVIGTISGTGVINTTTALDDAYSAGNFRGVASEDGTEFWTSGSSVGSPDEYTHYAQLGASTSTIITGPSDPADTNAIEIINGQVYESTRSTPGSTLAGIYQVGTGLPTTAGQAQSLFIETTQSNPLNVTDTESNTGSFGFYMADLSSNPYSINGVNVAYTSDEEMGIARYDYDIVGNESTPQWNFSYYIDSTGSYLDNAYTVSASGQISATSNFNPNNPAASADPSKAGGARDLTGRVVTVDGQQQVQLFFLTGFGTGSRPLSDDSLMEVTDAGAGSGYTVLATDTGTSQLTGVAFTPTQTVSSTAAVTLPAAVVTVTDNGGTYNGSAYAATDTVNGGSSLEGVTPTLSYYSGTAATGAASTVAPSAAGTYTVVASFSGSTDYASAEASTTFTIAQATPSVTVSDNGGTYDGAAFAATDSVNGGSSLEGVTPTLSYYSGTAAIGVASTVAPSTAGTYTVVANFAGSSDYASAEASTTFTIAQATPSVTVSDNGGTYDGAAFAASDSVNGGASLEGVAPTLTYYSGTAATSTGSNVAPSTAGTYTVVASFAGSTDYTSAAASTTFSIGRATPTVTVTDNGGVYTGSAYPASDTVNGGASLESVTPTLTYYSGTAATGTGTTAAPSTAGTYTVVASFAGSTDYTSAAASTTFSITSHTATVSVSDAGGVYNGSAYSATATVNGGASLEGVTPMVTYYSGTAASGTALGAAPSNAGTYTVVASFAGSADYGAAKSSPVTFVISPDAVNYTIGNAAEIVGTQLNLASVLPATFSTGIGSQTLALSYTSTGDSASAALGAYPINATAGNGTGLASNYSVTFTLGTLSVIPSPTVGVLLLDGSTNNSLNVSGSGTVSVTGGGNLILDSTDKSGAITASGAAIVSASTVDAASTSLSGSAKVEGTLVTNAGSTANPFASLPAPSVPTTVRSTSQLVIGGVTVETLQPGLYIGGIEVTASAKVTLAPGIYYLEGGGFSVSGAASVTGTGVLIYNGPSSGGSVGSINISASGVVNLTGMESGIYQGVAIFQATTATAAIQVSGAAQLNVVGTVYAAAATVQVTGSGSLNLNGTTLSEGGSELVLTDHLVVADMQVSGAADVTVNTNDNDLALSPNYVDYYFGGN